MGVRTRQSRRQTNLLWLSTPTGMGTSRDEVGEVQAGTEVSQLFIRKSQEADTCSLNAESAWTLALEGDGSGDTTTTITSYV